MITVPEPIFVERDLDKIVQDNINIWERVTGKKLQPAQVERLFINQIAYREYLIRCAIQEAAKMNLLAYAKYPVIDYLGEFYGVLRLGALKATVEITFTLDEAQPADVIVPSGTRVETSDGKVSFATKEDLLISAGAVSGSVWATATTAGAIGNGYLPGSINIILDPTPHVTEAANVATSDLGADPETDDQFRERIRLAPERYSTAGSRGSYEYWARSAHPDIVDIKIRSPQPGHVNVFPLVKTGVPSQNILKAVDDALDPDTRRPLTDFVHVIAPTQINVTITALITIESSAVPSIILSLIDESLKSYHDKMIKTLGRDIVCQEIASALMVPGVYNASLTVNVDGSGLETPAVRELQEYEFASLNRVSGDISIIGAVTND
jgi:phage-related baseplate assembly protein